MAKKAELVDMALGLGVEGASKMSVAELELAIAAAEEELEAATAPDAPPQPPQEAPEGEAGEEAAAEELVAPEPAKAPRKRAMEARGVAPEVEPLPPPEEPPPAAEPPQRFRVARDITLALGGHVVTLKAGKVVDGLSHDLGRMRQAGVVLEPVLG